MQFLIFNNFFNRLSQLSLIKHLLHIFVSFSCLLLFPPSQSKHLSYCVSLCLSFLQSFILFPLILTHYRILSFFYITIQKHFFPYFCLPFIISPYAISSPTFLSKSSLSLYLYPLFLLTIPQNNQCECGIHFSSYHKNYHSNLFYKSPSQHVSYP